MNPSRLVAAAMGGTLLCAGAATLIAVSSTHPASAQTTPDPGDPRATAVEGNAVTCAQAGLPGTIVAVTATISSDNRFVTITDVPDGVTLTGTVVKGGPAYNIYPGSALTDLHSPLVSQGNIPEISHWFSCGNPATTTSTPTSTPTHHKHGLYGKVGHDGRYHDSQLAWTGFPTGTVLAVGVVLMALGLVLVAPPRRLREAFAHGRRRH